MGYRVLGSIMFLNHNQVKEQILLLRNIISARSGIFLGDYEILDPIGLLLSVEGNLSFSYFE